jgi:hypothetical protein
VSHTMDYKPYVVGGLTGLLEIGITHPMDVHKTKRQVITTNVSRSMFAGIAPRLIGIIPMRVLFWGVQEDMRKRRFHPVMAGASAGLVQTLIDAPVDNHKIARITQTTPRWFRGFGCMPCATWGLLHAWQRACLFIWAPSALWVAWCSRIP